MNICLCFWVGIAFAFMILSCLFSPVEPGGWLKIMSQLFAYIVLMVAILVYHPFC